MHCGTATPTEPGVPPRTATTGVVEVSRVKKALANRYAVERILGEGGMATVYLAKDLKHNRKVAVKVMRPELAATLGADRFLREVEIAGQLSHPHILPMYDSGEAEKFLYYVMPYVEGESLAARMKREGQMPVEDAVRIAREVAEALGYAHERGIVHRDIKPANILISGGHALVADFGIARAVGAGGDAITATGLAVGTPQYMSPEQASGAREVDGRADIYAVAAVLYEMLAGEPPFTGPTAQAIIARSLTEDPRPLTKVRQSVPAQLSSITERGLAKSPADRPTSAVAFANALGAAMSGSGGTPIVAATIPASSGPSPAMVWGLFLVGSVAGLLVAWTLMKRWGLPVWSLGFAVVLLAIGAVVLVLTGKAEKKRRAGIETPNFQGMLTWTNAAIGGALALGFWAIVASFFAIKAPGGSGDGIRLAILPFEMRGGSESNAYLGEGIADEVRGKLTMLPGFQVTARSSSDQYKATTKSLQDIGKELGVDYILTAVVRVQPGGTGQGRVQVVPELIASRTGTATWQQTFDADLTDVFQVQSQIASRVAGALGVALGAADEKRIEERATANPAAWDLYLKGRGITSRDPASLRQAAGYFDQAAALDTTFAQAYAQLGQTLVTLYGNGTPDPGVASRAREAATLAMRLAPREPQSHLTMAAYLRGIERDYPRAQEHLAQALQIAPNDVNVLAASATNEAILGRFAEALAHAEHIRRLDPRSVNAIARLANMYLNMRRYPEALATGNDALALAPSDLNIIQTQAMTHLAMGDLAAARAVFANVPGEMGQPALVAYMATYNDLFWVLTDEQQQVLLRLPPSAFFDDPAAWGSVFMQTYWLRGDKAKARAYADTAHMAFVDQLEGAPNDAQLHVLDGLALAYMGRKAEAIAQGEKGVSMQPISLDAQNGAYYQHQLARIYLMVGEKEKALDMLEPLLAMPYWLSPGWLRIDPTFAELKGNPRFEKLLGGT
jgi:serine/threonine-protein kinase